MVAVLFAAFQLPAQVPGKDRPMEHPILHRTIQADGNSIFYREAGPQDAPTLLLLHGFPSSSRMFEPLFARLSDRYHLVAPDYPGFGHSDWPDPKQFDYTFDHIASVMDKFTQALGLSHYTLYMQDYGGPVGFRLALAHPERVRAIIVQNAVAHNEGLGTIWATRRAFWADRPAHEEALRKNLLSLTATRTRHVGDDPKIELYDPDLWTDEYAFLNAPGQARVQSDLFYDYRTNVAAYPRWQAWLQKTQPKLLVLWGKHDPSFDPGEPERYHRDVPKAEVHVLDAGHFALDTKADEMAALVGEFMSKDMEGETRRGMTDRRSDLTALGQAPGPFLANPATAQTAPPRRRAWKPDGSGWRARIGVLTPDDDTVPESEFWTMAPDGVSVHAARVPLVDLQTYSDHPGPDNAVDQLARLPLHSIVFAFTTTSYQLGTKGEQALKARLEKRSKGIPVLLPTNAAAEAVRALGARRIALFHPPWFTDDAVRKGVAYFQDQGFEVVHASHMTPERKVPHPNLGSDVSPGELYEWVGKHTPANAEVVFIAGNGFRTIGVIAALEEDLGRPVLTGNQVAFWYALRLAGVGAQVDDYGRVFRTKPKNK
jgi:pimeloyl-ACP methyl ester carboxylesterase/maleate cis-trans isomerase